MEQLKAEERLTAYIIMLAESNDEYYTQFGFCNMGLKLFGIDHCFEFMENFPEIAKRKPIITWTADYFFSIHEEGWKKRKELLKECIEELILKLYS